MDAIVRPWVVAFSAALILFAGIAARTCAAGEEIVLLGRLIPPADPEALPDGWKPLTFKNIAATTRYSIVPNGAAFVLKAESRAAASGLYRPVDLAPTAYPILAWRWNPWLAALLLGLLHRLPVICGARADFFDD